MPSVKEKLESIFRAGINAVAPGAAILRHVEFASGSLLVDGKLFWSASSGVIRVVGAGKGAAPMAGVVEEMLGNAIADGFVVVKTGHGLPLRFLEIGEASHPVPDAAGEAAARRLLDVAARCKPGDLLFCVLTGGASALTPAPARGLTLEDIGRTTSLLLASGANIHEINAIRKHLSRFGGGQLAAAANGAHVLALIVSDVIGDSLEAIASGPTAPDPTTFHDCLNIVEKYHLRKKLSAAALAWLEAGAAGKAPETPKPRSPVFEHVLNVIVASNAQALAACAAEAGNMGYEARILTDRLEGEARQAAQYLVEQARQALGAGPVCILAGGETTVSIKGRGKGGRNQEMALAAALLLEKEPKISALFAGTDGTDGPTDAAGGFAFADTVAKMGGAQKAREYLDNNDSWQALRESGDLLVTGPTLTNVMDLAILLVE